MVECAKSGIYRKLMFLEEFLSWFGGFINKIKRDIAGARKIFADQPADLLQLGPEKIPKNEKCREYFSKEKL